MKVIFLVPPSISRLDSYAYDAADKADVPRIWVGILYVAAALRKHLGIVPVIIDAPASGMSLEEIERVVTDEKPDIVAFSVLTFNLVACLRVAEAVKKVSTGTSICFGGWHPTLYPQETLGLAPVDYVVIGEGEETFSELVDVLRNNRQPEEQVLRNIAGIGFRDATGNAIITAPRMPMTNLDDIPFPAYDLIDLKRYSNILADSADNIAILTTRGCPHSCTFCDIRKSRYRYRSPEKVMDEIRYWYDQGIAEFYIQDDNFTINRKRALELCRLIIDSRLNVRYKISSRVDHLDDELVAYLKRSGCYRINFGVESGSQKVLDYLQKGIRVEQIQHAFRLAKKHGVSTFAYIMIGTPVETAEDYEHTAELIKRIKPDHLHCSICTPMPETHLYRTLLKEGGISTDYWREFAKAPTAKFTTPFCNPLYTDEELRAFQNSIQKKFYLQPRVIFNEVKRIRDVETVMKKARLAFKVIFG
jgi:radical SAM superfamily enzyme YgiQ (UPF0313 family)